MGQCIAASQRSKAAANGVGDSYTLREGARPPMARRHLLPLSACCSIGVGVIEFRKRAVARYHSTHWRYGGMCVVINSVLAANPEGSNQMIRVVAALGFFLAATNSSSAQSSSYCAQVRQAVATYGYAASRRHALAHYGRKAVRFGDNCLRGRLKKRR
jgi:hypothetical protein